MALPSGASRALNAEHASRGAGNSRTKLVMLGTGKVKTHEMTAGVVYRDDRVTVDAFRVPHGKWEHAFGFRFRTPDRVIVISGDTAFSPTIAKQCNGCVILVHEGGFSDNSAYFRESHTSAKSSREWRRQQSPNCWFCITNEMQTETGCESSGLDFRDLWSSPTISKCLSRNWRAV